MYIQQINVVLQLYNLYTLPTLHAYISIQNRPITAATVWHFPCMRHTMARSRDQVTQGGPRLLVLVFSRISGYTCPVDWIDGVGDNFREGQFLTNQIASKIVSTNQIVSKKFIKSFFKWKHQKVLLMARFQLYIPTLTYF